MRSRVRNISCLFNTETAKINGKDLDDIWGYL